MPTNAVILGYTSIISNIYFMIISLFLIYIYIYIFVSLFSLYHNEYIINMFYHCLYITLIFQSLLYEYIYSFIY